MATKSKINKGRKGTDNLPAKYDAELAEAARKSMERMRVPTQGTRISIKGKQFSIGGRVIGPELRCAVVNFGYAHAYYPGVYNEKAPQPPVCFSLSLDPKALAPHAIAPEKQHANCETCPKNEFGSATTGSGRGKACKDIVRIAVMHEDDLQSAESVSEGKIATLDLPAMSIKGWTEYSRALVSKTEREMLCFITAMTFEAKSAFPIVEFELIGPVDDSGAIVALKRRQAEADELILSPWQPLSEDKRKAAAPSGRAAPARGGAGAGRSRFK
jgi:hypothetical protein